jgi:ArsR family transcriptional regulator
METESALAVLSGLSQGTRLGIFRLLVEVGHEGLSAGDIATRLSIPPTTLSFHLKNMSHAGLVICQRQGTTKIYSADFDAMNDLIGYLTANCCGGDMSACAPKAKSPKRRKARGS